MKELTLLAIVGMNPIAKYLFLAFWIVLDLSLIALLIWLLLPHKIDEVEDDLIKFIKDHKGGIVGNTDKFIKDHINKGSSEYIMTEEQLKRLKDHFDNKPSKDPIPISGTMLLRGFDPKGKEFISKATNCTLRFEDPSEDQQKKLFIANEKAERIMKNVSAAFAECASKVSKEKPLGEVSLIVDNDITVTVQIELAPDAERK